MGYHLYREVKRHAPDDLDTGELALLLILADEANDQTRECFPGMDELCAYMRMSADGVGRVLQRLTKRGIDVRVAVGKDKTGRAIYAMKGVRTTYRLPRFAPPMPGPQSGQSANGRTPGRPLTDQRPDASPANTADRPDASPSMPGPQSGPSPQFPHEEDPHLLPPQRIIRAAGITLGEDDEKRFIEWINRDTRKGTPWWRTVAKNGDLPGLVAEWREAATPGKPPNGLPTWCGKCHERTRMLEDPDDGRNLGRCPRCHPTAVGTQRPAAAGPYRNPTDHSVYFEPIQ